MDEAMMSMLQEIRDRLAIIETSLKMQDYSGLLKQVHKSQQDIINIANESSKADEKFDLRMIALEEAINTKIQNVKDDVDDIRNDLIAVRDKNKVLKNAIITSVTGIVVAMIFTLFIMAAKMGWIG